MARLFVSHATIDEPLVEEFVELLQIGIGVHPDDIFCSSLPGMGIPTGKDFVDHIKSKVQNPEMVLLILSPAFFKSQFCQNEVGASWGLSLPIYPILVPPTSYSDLTGVLAGRQAAKLDDKDKLNDLRDDLSSLLKLTQFRTSHWERKRDKFLGKLPGLISQYETAVAKPAITTPTTGLVITSSGSWLKLGGRFYEAHKVQRSGKQKINVELYSTSGEEEAALDALRPPQAGRGAVVGFAYQNDGGLVKIERVESTSHGGRNLWTIELMMSEDRQGGPFAEMNIQQHSANEIAAMRAGRLLINAPPPPRKSQRGSADGLVEHAIVGGDATVKIDDCVVRSIVASHKDTLEMGMQYARLEAVFRLKATGIVESIVEFSIGPLSGKSLHVKFQGQRRQRYQNEMPEIISIEGDCNLGDVR